MDSEQLKLPSGVKGQEPGEGYRWVLHNEVMEAKDEAFSYDDAKGIPRRIHPWEVGLKHHEKFNWIMRRKKESVAFVDGF